MNVVYALRKRGTIEPRYIGRTNAAASRFAYHLSQARAASAPTLLQQWLIEPGELVEQVILAECESDIEAMRIERETVHACLRLGFSLLNVHLMPEQPIRPMSDNSASLLRRITAFCTAKGMSETEFGQRALGDKPFVSQLRAGRDVRVSTIERINAFMATYRPEDKAA